MRAFRFTHTGGARLLLASVTAGAQTAHSPTEPTDLAGSNESRPNLEQPTPTPVAFTEKTEILRNSDLELLLTNRGAGIREAELPGHVVENGAHVKISAGSEIPIGAILE